jgi:hypothetical protein
MSLRRFAPLLGALALAACATASAPRPVVVPASEGWTAMQVQARPVGLGLPGGARLGPGVQFVDGFEFVADAASPFHSLSDLKTHDAWFYAVSDAGDLFRFVVPEDAATGRLVNPARFEGRRLTLRDGRPIADKADGDAEGLAIHGRTLIVSFERDHRIWSYGRVDRPDAVPTTLPAPPFAFALNDGMEAISTAEERQCDDAARQPAMPGSRLCLRVAGEGGGVWDCGPQGCVERVAPPPTPLADGEYRITGMDRDPTGDGWFVVQRSYSPPIDARARVRRMAPDGTLGPVLVELKLPGTTDNFEGIAAIPRAGGGVRVFILSDDNNSARQKTLLLAFDVGN